VCSSDLGIPELPAHLFVFYYAILSAITPPVCASVYAAAALAQANFWKVAGHALRLAVAIYVVPFLFVFRPGILAQGSWTAIALDYSVSLAAIFAVSVATSGWLNGKLSWFERAAFIIAAALLFYVGSMADYSGGTLLLLLVLWRKSRPQARSTIEGDNNHTA